MTALAKVFVNRHWRKMSEDEKRNLRMRVIAAFAITPVLTTVFGFLLLIRPIISEPFNWRGFFTFVEFFSGFVTYPITLFWAFPLYFVLRQYLRKQPVFCIVIGAIPGAPIGALIVLDETVRLSAQIYAIDFGLPILSGAVGGLIFWVIAFLGRTGRLPVVEH